MGEGVALALLSSALIGTAVVLANFGLRYLHPARGALVSLPSATLVYWLCAPFLLSGEGWNATAFAIFAAVGVVFPAAVTLLNFASNRLTGPTIAGTISSTTPLFAVFAAVLFLGEPLTLRAASGTAAIVLGVVAFTARGGGLARTWAAWTMLLPIAGAAIRGGALAAVKAGRNAAFVDRRSGQDRREVERAEAERRGEDASAQSRRRRGPDRRRRSDF